MFENQGGLISFPKAGAVVYILLVFAMILGIGAYFEDRESSTSYAHPEDTQAIYSCMDRMAQQIKSQNVDVALLTNIYSLCYNTVATQFLTEEQIIRNDNLIFQRSENVVLMWMVVVITLSGVILAGLQLLASYRLASAGVGTLPGTSEVRLRPDDIIVKSSVIGVVILAISFAFFMVFVLYVYTLKDESQVIPGGGQAGLQPPNVGRLLPPSSQPKESGPATKQ